MEVTIMKKFQPFVIGLVFGASVLGVGGCKEEEPECIPSGKVNTVEVEKTPLPGKELNEYRKQLDSCHACVLSQRGFYSCQAAFQTKGENREELKKQARKLACTDAGFPEDACPDSAVKLLQCKGDAAPASEDNELARSFRKLMTKVTGRTMPEPPASSEAARERQEDAKPTGAQPENSPEKTATDPVVE